MAKRILQKLIEKPWAVYSFCSYEGRNASGIGKVTNLIDFAIQYSEEQRYSAKPWDPRYVKTFRTSAEALDYFFENNQEKNITKQKAQKIFLDNFPSERINFEKLLAQSQPKCTGHSIKPFEERGNPLDAL